VEVKTVAAGTVFKALKKNAAKLQIPVGSFDESDPEDVRLRSLVPAVDPYYRFPSEHVISLLLVLQERDNALLVGPTGVGKTMLPTQLAAKLHLPVTRINFHGELGSPEVFGYFGLINENDPDDDGWKWTALVNAIQRPGLVVLDEWDAARAEMAIGLQRLLEDHDPGLFLSERDEFIPRHPDCIVVATANTRGLGDDTGLYAGTGSQNFAQLNRFHLVLPMNPLPAKNMKVILSKVEFSGRKLKDEFVEAVVNFYDSTLSAWRQDELTAPLSVRMVLHFAKYFQILGPQALEATILQKLPTDKDKVVVEELADRQALADPARKANA
jgi:cobaltochelatase CobS